MKTIALALALALPAAAAEGDVVVERVIAVVDNAIVLASEVETIVEQLATQQPIPPGVDQAAVLKERRSQVLDTLIAEKLLDAEVRKLRIDVTAAEVDRIVKATMNENNLTEETLKMALGRQGLTLDEYKDQLKKQLTKMKIVQIKVKSRVNVTDTEVKTAAKQKEKEKERGASSLGFSKVRARHILYLAPAGTDAEEPKRKAMAARARLEAGESFSDLATAESEDPGSKGRGGDLGAFERGQMVPEFERAAFEAPVGKVVGPVRTPFGWHLILVDERIADAPGDPEKALEDLREQLYQKEVEAQFTQYIEELKRDAFIEKRL
ncbi:MAG: peptidylprolyl isomerase [Deltaproteobacteria bacterium]|nr:peptidylprolyl isomerase [Deltaproteobacteria bacterium]